MSTEITGFVLAGGKSSGMGTDKAAVQLNGRRVLDDAMETVRLVAKNVFILGAHQLYGDCGAEVIEDIFPGCGPLGGIHAALSHVAHAIQPTGPESQPSSAKLSLILAVDTPFIAPEFLSYLAERAMVSGAVVTTPE